MGAYLHDHHAGDRRSSARSSIAAATACEAYEVNFTGVFTNTTPTDAYRGAGRPEATYAIERIIEASPGGRQDPVEIRRLNFLAAFTDADACRAGSRSTRATTMRRSTRRSSWRGYDDLRKEQQVRRERGDTKQIGIGLSTYLEMCGLAPSRVLKALNYAAGGWDAATIRLSPTGKVQVIAGTSPHGQGHATTSPMIVADDLGDPFDDIEVITGDTTSPRSAWTRTGAGASRSAAWPCTGRR